MLCVSDTQAYQPLPPSVPSVGAWYQRLLHLAPLGGFQEAFIHDLLPLRCKHQLRDPQLEQLDDNPVVGGSSAPKEQLSVILQLYFKLQLHRGEEFVRQLFEE